jgi:DNA polymerase III delta prime subunit
MQYNGRMKELWYTKHHPASFDEYIFADEEHKKVVTKFLDEKSIPHLVFYGHRGTGKTSLAYLLKKTLEIEDTDFLELNASKDNSVDIVRNKISSFVSTMASGPFKIVFLDECERLSPAAQDTLRAMTVDYANNARFIFACNKVGKIIPELRSRCQELHFQSLDKNDMLERAAIILRKEKVKLDLETLDKYVDAAYPDFRKLIGLLEKNSINGVLTKELETKDALYDTKVECMLYVENGDWDSARKLLAEQFTDEDYEDAYEFFYTNLTQLDKFKDVNKWKAAIVLIAEYLYRNQFVADKEINFCAMMIRLSDL